MSALKDKQKLKIDAALYKQSEVPTDGRPHWECSHLLIEFKHGGGQNDPYDDEAGDGASETRTDVRGQITTYVANAFSQQHRNAMFFLLVNGCKLRVTRWDRSGTVFTEAFKYTDERTRLRNVLWGFSRLDEEQQGFDTTATLLKPGDAEYALMDTLKAEQGTDISEVEGTIVAKKQDHCTFRFVRKAFANSLEDDAPRYCLIVPTDQGKRRFLVGKAVFVAPGMTGRGTRGFVAWDVTGQRFTFLKDAWRPHYENVSTEGKVLRDLRSAGVKNTPTYVCDAELGDVTKTPLFAGLRFEGPGSKGDESVASGSGGGSKRKKTKPADSNTSGGTSQAQKVPDINTHIPPAKPTPADFQQGKNTHRHFRHYRVVVEEVCLPLSDFKTGEQLISIIRDCVRGTAQALATCVGSLADNNFVAHEGAATKGKVLHRDISGGNILICPTVEGDEHGVLRVKWRGMLADWEMSKPIAENEETQTGARQVVRTVSLLSFNATICSLTTSHRALGSSHRRIFSITPKSLSRSPTKSSLSSTSLSTTPSGTSVIRARTFKLPCSITLTTTRSVKTVHIAAAQTSGRPCVSGNSRSQVRVPTDSSAMMVAPAASLSTRYFPLCCNGLNNVTRRWAMWRRRTCRMAAVYSSSRP